IYYALALLLFALSLLSKPMLVTLPFLLLLLDYWPLERWRAGGPESEVQRSRFQVPGSRFARLLVEKAPFIALSAASSVVTFLVQKQAGAVLSFERVPIALRLANVLVSYLRYAGKLLWPHPLAIPYLGRSWPLHLVLL